MVFINESELVKPGVVVCLGNTPYACMHITTHTAPCVRFFGLKQINAQHIFSNLGLEEKTTERLCPLSPVLHNTQYYITTQSNFDITLSKKLQPFSSHRKHCPILTWQVYVS